MTTDECFIKINEYIKKGWHFTIYWHSCEHWSAEFSAISDDLAYERDNYKNFISMNKDYNKAINSAIEKINNYYKEIIMNKPLIIYHGGKTPCPDGTCAALVAWQFFKKEVELCPTTYGDTAPNMDNREVYILDFSYSAEKLTEMAKTAKKIVVLDHHASAQKELAGLQNKLRAKGYDITIIFDMNKSGAKLTWEYFYPNENPPYLVLYVEDRDLWHWSLPMSREINAAISSYDYSVESYDKLSVVPSIKLYDEGFAILRYQNKEIEEMIKISYITKFGKDGEYQVPICNCTVKSMSSELANRLARDHLFSVTWYQNKDGQYCYSLRSIISEGKPGIDVSEVAKKYNGGGHKSAAGLVSESPLHTKSSIE